MKACETGDARRLLVQPRVIFHRAAAERVHAKIDRIIPGRDAGEVPYDIDLGDLWNSFESVTPSQIARYQRFDRLL
mgnify:CR=1 FL=1